MIYRHDDDGGRSLATGGLFFSLLCFCAFVSAHFLPPALMLFYLNFGQFFLFISLFAPLVHFRRSDWDILANGSNSACIPHLFPLPRFISKITIVILVHTFPLLILSSKCCIFIHTRHSSCVAFSFWSFCPHCMYYQPH